MFHPEKNFYLFFLYCRQFSPYYNRRDDNYGGPIGNRARIIYEILEAVRNEVGPDYPVFIKMHCSDDWDDNGLGVEDSLHVAKELEKRGITGIEFSGGNLDVSNYPNSGPIRGKIIKEKNQSYFAEKTAKIAEQLKVPVISVGGNRSPQLMEKILNESKISYFSMSRALLSEPDLVNKWQEGNTGKLRCVACDKCWQLFPIEYHQSGAAAGDNLSLIIPDNAVDNASTRPRLKTVASAVILPWETMERKLFLSSRSLI